MKSLLLKLMARSTTCFFIAILSGLTVASGSLAQSITFGSQTTSLNPVKGSPFTAEYEEILSKKLPDGTVVQLTKKGTIYRDGKGSRREDFSVTSESNLNLQIIVIYDAVGKRLYGLDSKTKTYTTIPFPSVKQSKRVAFFKSFAGQTLEEGNTRLKAKVIEGLRCEGTLSKTNGCTIETWYSNKLKEVVLEEKTCEMEKRTIRLFNIKQDEPDEQLFKIPQEYKLKDK